jgi:anti-anti-sigma factor
VTGGTVTVMLRGEFDITTEGSLADRLERIRDSRPRRLIFETAHVTFMDCASARLIARTGRWLPAGVKPVISRPPPIVRRILQASGIEALCEIDLCGHRHGDGRLRVTAGQSDALSNQTRDLRPAT